VEKAEISRNNIVYFKRLKQIDKNEFVKKYFINIFYFLLKNNPIDQKFLKSRLGNNLNKQITSQFVRKEMYDKIEFDNKKFYEKLKKL